MANIIPSATPNVSFSARVDMTTANRARRLQRRLGIKTPELVRRMVAALEAAVESETQSATP